MTRRLLYAAVPDRPRQVIHAVRVADDALDMYEIDDLTASVRDYMLSKHGEQAANVVVIIGDSKETLRLFGETHAVTRVRTAMFNAAISWREFEVG